METLNKSLEQIKISYESKSKLSKKRIIICAGTGCIANGALDLYREFIQEIKNLGLEVAIDLQNENGNHETVHVSSSGCQGFCAKGPLVTILPEQFLYVHVKTSDIAEIIEKSITQDLVVERLLFTEILGGKTYKGTNEIPFYVHQKRMVLDGCGIIDPTDIDEYIAHGGYFQAEKAYKELSSLEICDIIEKSGLRGRGGGGFPTGLKWKLTMKEISDIKYIICNGDEGDPGAFMDRSLMEGNPHKVIEGMMIAAKAVGANHAYIYVRMEYPLAVQRMKKAIIKAQSYGFLGKNIFDTGIDFEIEVMEGAGAFVCGEETALMSSIEGKRGMPSPKPPFPAVKGLFGKPTLINNVETFASIALILHKGSEWFSQFGTNTSKGTKTFALTGQVVNTGLIEVPLGTTLREIVFKIGGGITMDNGEVNLNAFKAVQIGGPSGGCLTSKHLDMPLDYENLKSVGAMVGSGGLVVLNSETCMVKIARYFMEFTQNESCGKCVPCREGTKQMLALLDEIIEGKATLETLDLLIELSKVVSKASLCGLGKSAPSPVLSTLEHFREEYMEHIVNKRCPNNQCKALRTISIDKEKCTGCTACLRKCPVAAISGEKKQAHSINAELCTKCGICNDTCKFGAIVGFN